MKTTLWTSLFIDIETYSAADLSKVGVYKYTEDPTFEVLLIGYAFDDDEVRVIDLKSGEGIPNEVRVALTDPKIIKTAHNANFERVCLAKHFNVEMDPEQWMCTAVKASMLGLPRSLQEVGDVLGLDEDKAKLKTGKQLIRYFSMPCAPTKRNGGRTRNLPEHESEQWELYKEYCAQDVITEREINKIFDEYMTLEESEHKLWCLDQRINDKGVLIQSALVDQILKYYATHQEILLDRAREISGVDNPKSIKQSREWLAGQGIETPSLNKDAVNSLLAETEDEDIIEYLEIRQELGKTSVSKYEAIERALCKDGRVKGILQFYGAERTGRWAGRIIQPQNLPRNTLPHIEIPREILKDGDFELFDMLYDKPMQIFSELIRTTIIPPEGHTFVIADFSAIEARVISWLADERWRMQVFETHGMIYEASAAQMFKIPIESITKDSPERAKGKVAELALGYQGSVGALKAMGAESMGLTEREMKSLVQRWRWANENIVRLWYRTEDVITDTIDSPGIVNQGPKGIEAYMLKDTLFIKLPSGRKLAYKKARLHQGAFKVEMLYEGRDQAKGVNKWSTLKTYGGKLVENITQAIARDCLAETLLALDNEGFKIAFHVHDEVVLEVPIEEKEQALKKVIEIMKRPIKWAPGLILTADAFSSDFYTKD